jgi:hypothetical protein
MTDLDGATALPAAGHMMRDAGEFAAMWNASTPEQRQGFFAAWAETVDKAARCVMQDHAALIERERMSWLSSREVHEWVERLLTFVEQWKSRPQNGPEIYTLAWMEGPDDAREMREAAITVQDLLIAAEFARRLAHDHISYAVTVNVKHYERRARTVEQAEIVVIDGRVLLDEAAVDELMTQAGWIEK